MNKTILFFLAVTLMLTACGPSTSGESEAAFCQALNSFEKAYETLLAVDAKNDQAGLESARDDLLDAYADLTEAADDMRSVKLNDLELAIRNLQVTVGAALGVSPADEAVQGIQKAAGDVKEAYEELFNANCAG